MKTLVIAVPLALALSACMTPYGDPYGQQPQGYPEPYPPQGYPDPNYPQPYPPQGYPDPGYPAPPGASDYRASGTEPFWDISIGREMVFTDRGTGLSITQTTPQIIRGTAGDTYRTQRLEVTVTRTPCSDGMSDRSYPDTVQVYADGKLYRGCGGAGTSDPLAPIPPGAAPPPVAGPVPAPPPGYGTPVPPYGGMAGPPLDRTRWQVVAINGRPVPPNGEYSMEFDNGRLSARFGCNSIGGTYSQAGPTMNVGALVGTQMACGDMSWESQGSAALRGAVQVTMLTPNRVTLTSSAGSIELQRR